MLGWLVGVGKHRKGIDLFGRSVSQYVCIRGALSSGLMNDSAYPEREERELAS